MVVKSDQKAIECKKFRMHAHAFGSVESPVDHTSELKERRRVVTRASTLR